MTVNINYMDVPILAALSFEHNEKLDLYEPTDLNLLLKIGANMRLDGTG
jgi:hypothetical protein